MPYFSKNGHTYSLRNNLEKQIFAILKYRNRKIIADDELKQFETDILNQIAAAHQLNPRCKPLSCKFHDSYEKNGDRIFSGVDPINFSIYKAK